MSDRFLFVYDPEHSGYEDTRILVLDRGPEVGSQMRGGQLRPNSQAAVMAVCHNEPTALRIIRALTATPGDERIDPDEEPF